MDAEELAHKKDLVEIRKKRRRFLEKQAAAYGLSVEAHIPIEIDELTQEIQKLEQEIALAERPRRPTYSSYTLRDVPVARQRPPSPVREPEPTTPSPSGVDYEWPYLTRGRLLLLVLCLLGTSYLLLTMQTSPAVTPWISHQQSPTSSVVLNAWNGVETLYAGQTWISDTFTLAMESATYNGDTITIKWRITNNSPNDMMFPSASYSAIGASAINGVTPTTGLSCEDYDCSSNLLLETGKSMIFTHILTYAGIQVSQYTGQVLVTNGITDKAQWSIKP